MNAKAPICATCGQPKTAETTASFTQWIFSCRCDAIEPEAPELMSCSVCGMPIDEKKTGSFTQWVFKSQICTCEIPRPIVRGGQGDLRAVFEHAAERRGNKSAVSLLDATNFPLSRYKPLDKLGAGGAGAVYLCFDNHLGKNVAVKVLQASDQEQLDAFQTEAKVTAKFKHPHVISIIDFGLTEKAAPYMVLEYVDGASLESLIQNGHVVSNDEFVRIFAQIASALGKGHEEGIFHRDIKSSNIIVTSTEKGQLNAHVIDYGIAIFDTTGYEGKTLIGTPKYMSPDQFLGKQFDPRSEIYSLGCVMYEVLTGRVPFQSDDVVSLLEKHANEKPVAPSMVALNTIDPELEGIVLKCLEKDPEDRFQSMGEVIEVLTEVSAHELNDALDSNGPSSDSENIAFSSVIALPSERNDYTSARFLVTSIGLVVLGLAVLYLFQVEHITKMEDQPAKLKHKAIKSESPEIVPKDVASKMPTDHFPGEAIQTPEEKLELDKLDKEIAVNKKDSQLYYSRSRLLAKMDRLEEAIADYNAAIKLVPTAVIYREELADLYLRSNRKEEAALAIDDAIKAGAVGGRLYKFKATLLADDHKLEEAAKAATLAVKLAPTYDGAYITRGQIYYKLGRYQDAVNDYTVAIKYSPNELRFLHLRANAYDKLNKHDLAMKDRKGGGSGDYGELLNSIQIGASSMRTLIKKSQEVEESRPE